MGWLGRVDGILLDLGVSSPQLDDASRGFSFRQDGPLDMRMNPQAGPSAAEWLADASEQDIVRVLKEYGEERFARRIARAIVAARREQPITTTGQLAAIVAAAVPRREPGKDPATRSFQAIRIFINRELDDLRAFLAQVLEVLRPGGRLVVISFHSLEDRLVKRFIREQEKGDRFPPDLPVTRVQLRPRLRAVGKPVRPGQDEIRANPRARSAILRVAERLTGAGE
ncbi:MAG TPA: 16S rRNA (cytosine(1402)-N(4))-methyltransferase RsmH [Chromatiales bacterium]|nr:16S rRNA (cytosine(1402)-N(4))-methyltransferase RsmH [Chromatiales bacterium]